MVQCFDVVLWRCWPSLMPDVCAYVEAATAFATVEFLMQRARFPFVACASARALDGSLFYRGYEVEVLIWVHECGAHRWEEVGTDG